MLIPKGGMHMNNKITGHCLCGAVSFEYEGPEIFMAHCHCESCRRSTSSPFTSYFGVLNRKWRWTGDQPETFASTNGVTRSFCGNCGSPMSYASMDYPGETHFFAASLADQSGFRPSVHVHSGEMVDWITLGDDLPRK